MTSSQQEMLRKAWLEGRHGNLCALSEAMLWAVREVWRAEKRSLHGLQTFAAGLVTKVGTGEHPTHRAVGLFYARVDADPEWYPGKSGQVIHGPAKALTSQQASAIARSAQALKARSVVVLRLSAPSRGREGDAGVPHELTNREQMSQM